MKNLSLTLCLIVCAACSNSQDGSATPQQSQINSQTCTAADMQNFERVRILAKADKFLTANIRTVTADIAKLSAGGPNDFFSQGDYWWPVPDKPDAPYERRDGLSNPENFVAHRNSMMRLSDILGTLATAHKLSGDPKYAEAANAHLKAWFVAEDTAMTPHLLYGQAIIGRVTGRSIGIIDTMHLVDVARAAEHLIDAGVMPSDDAAAVKSWFREYSNWMNTHPFGIKERDWYNNHSIAWSMQIASYASLTGDETLMQIARHKFKTIYLSDMMADDGSFPKETARTKPYSYSIFVYDLMAGVAQLASSKTENLWKYESDNGHSMRDGIEFIAPYMKDKDSWPLQPDIQYWEEPNQRRAFLMFGALAFDDCSYWELAKTLDPDPQTYEVVRNMPIRSPLLWIK